MKAKSATYKTYGVGEDNSWVEIPSDLMCFTAEADTEAGDEYHACDLFVKTEVRGLGITHIMVEATNSSSLTATQTESRTVENDNLSVEYTH